jgi:hypothetical protein
MNNLEPCWSCGSRGVCYGGCECAKCEDPQGYEEWKENNPEDYSEWLKKQHERDEIDS